LRSSGRAKLSILAALAVVAIVVVGLKQAGGHKQERLPHYDLRAGLQELEGAPAPLAALHDQHGQLLGGGTTAVKARLKELRGHPVVLNKWGSWCPPCRQEFPVFQHVATDRGRTVAFLGVDTVDNSDQARKFLKHFPLPYPSYSDPHGGVSQELGIPGGAPITLFLDEQGRTAFIHQGKYADRAALERDIDRYL
jgi:thiol-disulfide isomerase/thioredoxin